jgi:hypothetical protein
MLGRAEARVMRPRDHLAHIGVDVLAALGDGGVERPGREIAGKHDQHGALAARRIGERVEQALEPIASRRHEFGRGHRPDITAAAAKLLGRGLENKTPGTALNIKSRHPALIA